MSPKRVACNSNDGSVYIKLNSQANKQFVSKVFHMNIFYNKKFVQKEKWRK